MSISRHFMMLAALTHNPRAGSADEAVGT